MGETWGHLVSCPCTRCSQPTGLNPQGPQHVHWLSRCLKEQMTEQTTGSGARHRREAMVGALRLF